MTDIKKNKFRYCPACIRTVHQSHVESARFDFNCPSCGKYKLSEFLPTIPATRVESKCKVISINRKSNFT